MKIQQLGASCVAEFQTVSKADNFGTHSLYSHTLLNHPPIQRLAEAYKPIYTCLCAQLCDFPEGSEAIFDWTT